MKFPHVGGAEGANRVIYETAVFGSGCKVWDYARVLGQVVCGDYVSIGGGTEIGFRTKIGHRSRISANVFLPNDTNIGENVFVGPGVICTDDRHPVVSLSSAHYIAEPPTICDFASIGAGAKLTPGVRIGVRARVACGAVVTDDVPDGATVMSPVAARERAGVAGWE